MILTATTGTEAFALGASKFHTFFVPTLAFPGKEIHIGVAGRDQHCPVGLVGYPQVLPAAPGYRDELGKWTTGNYELPEGMVLKVFGYKKMAANSHPTSASQLIRMREGGPLQRIKMPTVGWVNAQYQTVEVTGRFDLLTVEEAAVLGVRVPPQYLPGFHPTSTERVFRYEEVEAERATKVQTETKNVVNTQGEEVAVRTQQRRRNMDL